MLIYVGHFRMLAEAECKKFCSFGFFSEVFWRYLRNPFSDTTYRLFSLHHDTQKGQARRGIALVD